MGIDRSRTARAFLAKPPLAIDKGSHAAIYHEEHLLAALLQDVPVLLVSPKDVLCLQARVARRAVGKDNIIVAHDEIHRISQVVPAFHWPGKRTIRGTR